MKVRPYNTEFPNLLPTAWEYEDVPANLMDVTPAVISCLYDIGVHLGFPSYFAPDVHERVARLEVNGVSIPVRVKAREDGVLLTVGKLLDRADAIRIPVGGVAWQRGISVGDVMDGVYDLAAAWSQTEGTSEHTLPRDILRVSKPIPIAFVFRETGDHVRIAPDWDMDWLYDRFDQPDELAEVVCDDRSSILCRLRDVDLLQQTFYGSRADRHLARVQGERCAEEILLRMRDPLRCS